jgi:hypothetical protein
MARMSGFRHPASLPKPFDKQTELEETRARHRQVASDLERAGGGVDMTAEMKSELQAARERLGSGEKPTNTNTEAFRKWFGESKVVDEKGDPLVVYHGTEEDFDTFERTEDIGFHFGTRHVANARIGASSNAVRETLRDGGPFDYQEGRNVIPAYLKIENPLRLPDLNDWTPDHVIDALVERGIVSADDELDGIEVTRERVRDWLAVKGYDGIVYRNSVEANGRGGDSFIVFGSSQIKSATGNRGTFDPSKPDITFSRSGSAFGSKRADVKAVADVFRAKLKGLPDIHSLQTLREAPAELRAAIRSVGGEANVAGAWHEGEIYLFADRISSPQHAAWVILHEATHHGLRGMFGRRLDPVLMDLYLQNETLRKAADAMREKDRGLTTVRAVEEVLADMGGDDLPRSVWQRIVARARGIIRSLGFNLDLTDSDIRELVSSALRFVKNPPKRSQAIGGTVAAARMPDWVANGPPEIKAAAGKIDTFAPDQTIGQKVQGLTKDWKKRLVQGAVDQFAPLKDLSYKAYVLARMTKSAEGVLEGTFFYGKPKIDADGAIVGDLDGKGFMGAMQELQGEHDRFFMWIAGNRSERLMSEGREHLFTASEIAAMKALNQGTMKDGTPRAAAYRKAAHTFRDYNKAILDIAEKTGLIDGQSRNLWEHDFYIPYFRVHEDDSIAGPSKIKGLVRQQAFKKLKGGQEPIGDLLANTLRNWNHLISASLANQAASHSLIAAERAGAAVEADEATVRAMGKSIAQKSGIVYFMDQGKERWFLVDDPFVLEAVSSIESAGFKGLPMKLMGKFKHYLTLGVTISPSFRIRNLLRDSIAAISQNEISYNVLNNLVTGFKGTNKKSADYAQMLFGGGLMRFGTLLDNDRAEHARRLIEAGVDDSTILTNQSKVKAALGKVWDVWQEFGDKMENVNRMALYKQLRAQNVSHLDAAFQARDMMDFSLQGSSTAMRFLTHVVPFLNARAQGLYKLGRAAKQNPRRFGAVTGAVALASIALMLAYYDDEDWKQREDWDRDVYWWFKIGDTAYRIPKPFEIGAIGTIAERSMELVVSQLIAEDGEMTGQRFMERMRAMLRETFAMNPVPQLFKPMMDIYSNIDSFTGRQIETRGMERLSKSERAHANTSIVARALGSAGEYTGLSPIQIDHLIRAYFGWLGSHTAMAVDVMAAPFDDIERASRRFPTDTFVIGDFVKGLPADQSRYVEDFYKQAKRVSEIMADIRQAREVGDIEKAREIAEDNKDKVVLSKLYSAAERRMGEINKQMRLVQNRPGMSGDEKRDALDRLVAMRNRLAKTVNEQAAARQQ